MASCCAGFVECARRGCHPPPCGCGQHPRTTAAADHACENPLTRHPAPLRPPCRPPRGSPSSRAFVARPARVLASSPCSLPHCHGVELAPGRAQQARRHRQVRRCAGQVPDRGAERRSGQPQRGVCAARGHQSASSIAIPRSSISLSSPSTPLLLRSSAALPVREPARGAARCLARAQARAARDQPQEHPEVCRRGLVGERKAGFEKNKHKLTPIRVSPPGTTGS